MDNFRLKAQVNIEFAVAFVVLAIFVVAAAKIFAWLGATMVNRNQAYEDTRSITNGKAPAVDFYNQTDDANKLKIFE
ncbi:MAG: hypothetical protein PHH68_08535 [Candidatus Omnitrophica bacterium]|nr:hypothetical protein [Candidatus Omnitrophota bacterium]